MLETNKHECYTIENPKGLAHKIEYPIGASPYPFLLVNFGSGVSFLRVDSPNFCERVGGSCLGGATFYGLVSTLANCESFQQCVEMAEKGDSGNVDMLVRDIYGGDYDAFGLKASVVASSFGKMGRKENRVYAKPEDMASSTMSMITNNVGSIAYLHAQRYEIERIVFSGNFLTGNPLAMRSLAYSLRFWSRGKIKPLFLEHEGYFGAIGALIYSFFREMPREEFRVEGQGGLVDSESDSLANDRYMTQNPPIIITEYAWEDAAEMVTITFSNPSFKYLIKDKTKLSLESREISMYLETESELYILALSPLHAV